MAISARPSRPESKRNTDGSVVDKTSLDEASSSSESTFRASFCSNGIKMSRGVKPDCLSGMSFESLTLLDVVVVVTDVLYSHPQGTDL